jgi:hypothetical protein
MRTYAMGQIFRLCNGSEKFGQDCGMEYRITLLNWITFLQHFSNLQQITLLVPMLNLQSTISIQNIGMVHKFSTQKFVETEK